MFAIKSRFWLVRYAASVWWWRFECRGRTPGALIFDLMKATFPTQTSRAR